MGNVQETGARVPGLLFGLCFCLLLAEEKALFSKELYMGEKVYFSSLLLEQKHGLGTI